jgi:phosphoribosylaminoimidazolecarboxamide formyltransferase/IMP cyclohydrolase
VELTPSALAYVRARGADPKSSYGDMIALSDPVDEATAGYIKRVVSDGIVAPSYSPAALEILASKKKGKFLVVQADPDYEAPPRETREVFGVQITQDRNARAITASDLEKVVCGELTAEARRDCLVGLVTLKYTQSNSVGYALGGQMIGIGAGQQSRVDCTKLAGAKADLWYLRQHPKVRGLQFREGLKRQDRVNWRVRYIEGDLTGPESDALADVLARPQDPLTDDERREWLQQLRGVSLVSDGLFPFRDNIDQAARHGVSFVAQPGGALRDADIEAACRDHGMAMAHTGLRLFHH